MFVKFLVKGGNIMNHSTVIKFMESKRLYLRRVEKTDVEYFLQVTSDPEIRRLTGTTTFLTRPKVENFIDSITTNPSRIDLIIVKQENDEVIGDLAMLDIDQQNRVGSFRIALTNKNEYGRGYGTEALKLVIDYMFNTLNLRKIAINVYAFNERAIKTYTNLGFKQEGRLIEDLYFDGEYYDNLLLALFKRDYRNN